MQQQNLIPNANVTDIWMSRNASSLVYHYHVINAMYFRFPQLVQKNALNTILIFS